MVGEDQIHFHHYHLLHYAESDPLMDHMGGSNEGHTRRVLRRIKGQMERRVGWQSRMVVGYEEAHRSTPKEYTQK